MTPFSFSTNIRTLPAPVAAHRNAPGSGAVALKLMHPPTGRGPDRLYISGDNERRDNIAEPLGKVRAQLGAVAIFGSGAKALGA
jgi:hypothetical protein